MATRYWYVNPLTRAAVNWGTAVVGNVAQHDIVQISQEDGGKPFSTLWAGKNTVVTSDSVTAAQARTSTDPIPAEELPLGGKPSGATPKQPLYIAHNTIGAVDESRYRVASTGKVVLSVAGNVRILLTNDGAVAQKNIQLVKLSSYASAPGWAELFINPTVGLPAVGTRRPKFDPRVLAGATAPVVPSAGDPISLQVDTDATTALSGGVNTGITTGIPGSRRMDVDLPPVTLAPAQSLGFNIPFTGSTDVVLNFYWIVL